MSQDDVKKRAYELGKGVGRQQAFDLVAKRCTAAAAEMLKSLRDSGKYKEMGLTWKQFCEKELGVSKPFADRQIHYIEQYGVDYFRIAEIVPLSESTYKLLGSAVHDGCIEVDGDALPISRENRKQVAAAVKKIRDRHNEAARKEDQTIPTLRQRFEGLMDDVCEAAALHDQRLELLKVLFEVRSRLEQFTNELRIRAC